MKRLLISAAAASFVLTSRVALSTPLSAFTSATTEACLGVPLSGPGLVCQSSNTSLHASVNLPAAQLTVDAGAAGAYGVLRAFANSSFDISGASQEAFGDAFAIFQDVLTINAASLTGQPGTLTVAYQLDGVVSPSSGPASGFARVVVNVESNVSYAVDYTDSVSGNFVVPRVFTFTYGEPFGVEFLLQTLAGGVLPTALGGYVIPLVSGHGSAGVDYFNTLTLSGLVPSDVSGTVVAGAQFTSLSGTAYGLNGVVPEAGTWALLSSGLLLLWAIPLRHGARGPSSG
jgi:hypothetical protein